MSNKTTTNKVRQKKTVDLKPRLRFPEFRNLPEWHEKKIKEVLTESCISGNSGDVAKKITVKLWGKGVFEKEEQIQGSVNTRYYKRKFGQFIYSKLDFLNQAFGIIPRHLDGFESTLDLPCFDWREGVNPIYFLEYVKRGSFYRKFGEIADGGRKAKRIQVETFLSFPILLPPKLAEQQKIADCLASINALIEAEVSKLEALKAHKKGLMQVLFPQEGETVPKVRFPEFKKAPKWQKKSIDNIAKVTTGNKDTQDKDERGIYPFFVRSQNVEKINSYSFDTEAVLTSGDGVGVGKNYHYINGKFDFHQRVYCLYNFKKMIDGKFVFYYFSEHFYSHVIQLSAKNSVDSVRRTMITEMPILIPQHQEQKKIVGLISSIDDMIAIQTHTIELLKTHKKGLLQQLFPKIDEARE